MAKRNIRTFEDKIIDFAMYILTSAAALLTLYPFLNVIAVAFSDYKAYLDNPMMVIPKNLTLSAFRSVLQYGMIRTSYLNTIIITFMGTFIGIVLTILTAYPLSKKGLAGKPLFMNAIIFTMLFGGGIVPKFLLIRDLGLYDSLWALILPACLSPFNIVLMKNFFSQLPESLEEAAKIDGASDPYVLVKIIVPLSKPIIATMVLFLAVSYWNSYFSAVMYIRSQTKWTLQLVLREVIYSAQAMLQQTQGNYAEMNAQTVNPATIQYATLLVAMLPIMCVYPFLQKYFVKGVMVGAVKG